MKVKFMFEFEGEPINIDAYDGERYKENCLETVQFFAGDSRLASISWDTYLDIFVTDNKVLTEWDVELWRNGCSSRDVDLCDLKAFMRETEYVVAEIRNDTVAGYKPMGKMSIFLEDGTEYVFDMKTVWGSGREVWKG